MEKFNEYLKFFLLSILILSAQKGLCSGGDVPPVPPGDATLYVNPEMGGGEDAW